MSDTPRPLHSAEAYFDMAHCPCPEVFEPGAEVWDALPRLAAAVAARGPAAMLGTLAGGQGSAFVGPMVHVGRGTIIQPGACLVGPAWIGEDCRIGPGCWIREHVIVGRGAILGNSCELKNCLVGESAEIPHWNYVGDSLVGWKAHLGAGVILSNWRHDHGAIPVLDPRAPGGRIATGLPKFGAVVGDHADLGAHAVLNPGSLIGPRSVLYPGTVWRGVLSADRLVKLRQEHVVVERRPPPIIP